MSLNKINNYIIAIILISVFNIGLLDLLGIDSYMVRLLIDCLLLLVIVCNFFRKISWIYITIVFYILLALIIVSFLLSEVSAFSLFLFIRTFIIPILFLLSIKNINKINISKIDRLLNILFIEQIIASIIKLIVHGRGEDYIGAMSIYAGELATVFPLLAISFYFTKYLYSNNLKYLLITPFFLIISYSSLKFGTIIYLPIIFIFNYLIWFWNQNISRKYLINFIKQIFSYGCILLLLFYVLVRLNPRANPERKVGGTFDINYLYNFSNDYTNKFKLVEGNLQTGRLAAFKIYFQDLTKKPLKFILLGNGPGSIQKTSLIKTNYDNFKANYGYGSKLGIIWLTEQIGLLGLFAFSLFQILIYVKIARYSNSENFYSIYSKVVILIFFIDFFTYSSSFILSLTLSTYFYLIIIMSLYNKKETIAKY